MHRCLFCTEKCGTKISSLGGIEAIMSAMSNYKDHSEVQLWACNALGNLAINDGMFLFVRFLFFINHWSVML